MSKKKSPEERLSQQYGHFLDTLYTSNVHKKKAKGYPVEGIRQIDQECHRLSCALGRASEQMESIRIFFRIYLSTISEHEIGLNTINLSYPGWTCQMPNMSKLTNQAK